MALISILDKFLNSSFIRNVLTISMGTAISQLLLIITTPVLTRLYSPNDFGVLAVFISLLSIAVVASSFRYEVAIPLPKQYKHSRELVILCLLINSFSSIFYLLIVIFFSREISLYTKMPLLEHYLWLLPFGVLCLGTYKIFTFLAIKKQSYATIAKTKLVQSVLSILIQITGGFFNAGAIGLIIGRLAGQSAGAFMLAQSFNLTAILTGTPKLILKILVLAKKYKNFLKYDVAASIIDTLNTQLPQILLAIMFGPAITGYYMLIDRVLAMPASLIGQAVGQVFYGNWQKSVNTGRLFESTNRVIKILVAVIVFPTAIIFFSATYLFPWFFGIKWTMAGIFATWMVFGSAAQFVYSPISMALMATNDQKINLIIHSILLICKIAGCMIGYLLQSSLLTVQILSFANLAIYGTGILLISQRVKKYSLETKN